MPLLTDRQLSIITSIKGGEHGHIDLYLPAGLQTPVSGRMHDLYERACWNWALYGGDHPGEAHPSSPPALYAKNYPLSASRPQLPQSFPQAFPERPQLKALWLSARRDASNTADKVSFLQTMAEVAAIKSGLLPVDQNTPYKIHVTTAEYQWYSYSHWGLSITYNGRTRFIQTEPNKKVNWGATHLWETDRLGYIEASFNIESLHQKHVDVIEALVHIPMCSKCAKAMPEHATDWKRCKGRHPHLICDTCPPRFSRRGFGKAPRRVPSCTKTGCNAELAHLN